MEIKLPESVTVDWKAVVTLLGILAGGQASFQHFFGASSTVTNPRRDLTPTMQETFCKIAHFDKPDTRIDCVDWVRDRNDP